MNRSALADNQNSIFLLPGTHGGELFRQQLNPSSVTLWLVDIDRAEQALWQLEEEAPRLSWRERVDFETASNFERARIRLGAHIALRLVLERWLGATAVRGVAYEVEKGGKPFLSGSGVDFSVSYSGSKVLIGVRAGGAIGVDLECDREVRMTREQRNRIIAMSGILKAQTCPAAGFDETTHFLQAWTRMEALAKATGLGIGRVLGHFGLIGPDKGSLPDNRNNAAEFAERYDLVIDDLDVLPGLYASIAQIKGTVCPEINPLPDDIATLREFVDDRRFRL